MTYELDDVLIDRTIESILRVLREACLFNTFIMFHL